MGAAAHFFESDPQSPSLVRRWLRGVLDHWKISGARQQEISLIASELATNAVMHAKSAYVVLVRRQPNSVQVAVADGDPRLPQPRSSPPEEPGGRGLKIVAAVASRWGATPVEHDGKIVWCEVESGEATGSRSSQ
jgi:anti-sigma regulatory factor (Ser/Thr protein kinase)